MLFDFFDKFGLIALVSNIVGLDEKLCRIVLLDCVWLGIHAETAYTHNIQLTPK